MSFMRGCRGEVAAAILALIRWSGPVVLCLAGAVPHGSEAFAQASGSGHGALAGGTPVEATSAIDVVMADAIGAGVVEPAQLAAITVDGQLQGLVDALRDRSVAFRRQWQRLRRFWRLHLRIELAARSPVAGTHAATTITRLADGSVVAVVSIPGGPRLAELLGHEIEHVLERLDGVRVDTQHELGDRSVSRQSGTFETVRAARAGRLVLAEYQGR